MYTIITENDESNWNDTTGTQYHFPSRYKIFLEPGTKVIYYKGKQRKKKYSNRRLTSLPHYFGIAEVINIYKDSSSDKNDHYADLNGYLSFAKPVYAKINDQFLEIIPENRKSNHWRDGVRPINEEIFNRIIALADIKENMIKDHEQGELESYSLAEEGKAKQKVTTVYERNRYLRSQAIRIHGYTCKVCGFNFGEIYGETGIGYIHVHHIIPLSETKGIAVNPKTDMCVLCANCHSMIHRNKKETLSIEMLKEIIKK